MVELHGRGLSGGVGRGKSPDTLTAGSNPIADVGHQRYFKEMRDFFLVSICLFGLGSCSQNDSAEVKGWTAKELSSAVVGFGWNFKVEGRHYNKRFLDVVIQPDNTFKIYLGEYKPDSEPMTLAASGGQLEASVANELRRDLQGYLPRNRSLIHTPLEGCPVTAHPDIEYFVGFALDDRQFVTTLEAPCQTQEAERFRSAVENAFARFPGVDQDELKAGSNKL